SPLYTKARRLNMVMHFFDKTIFSETIFPLALYIYLMEKLVGVFYRKDPFIAISESTKSEVQGVGIPEQNIHIVEPGICTSFFYKSCGKSDVPLLVYVGRLMKYKNVQFIIRGFAKIRETNSNAILKIAGSGDYLKSLKQLCLELGVEESVQFVGRISEEEKRDLLSSATIFVNPSRKEGWGINNIEANLCGTVSLSSNVPGLRDSVQDNVTGLLYEPENIDDFVSKAQLLISNDKLRSELEKNALIRAKSLDWDNIADKMDKVIRQFL
ncbi:MAG: glycosyltransferase family 4 protein, partial [Fibrobacter sp.]|nr:glycosyltransferase family 4 protein [Fibrobacter sp.]